MKPESMTNTVGCRRMMGKKNPKRGTSSSECMGGYQNQIRTARQKVEQGSVVLERTVLKSVDVGGGK